MFGLPEEVKFCKICCISNQRPNSSVEYLHTAESKKETIHFDDEGVCDACRVAEKKKETDWEEREKELKSLCEAYRSRDGRYDCIVPGSGGKDSYYASHILKYKYGMHPLTVTWCPHIYTDWGRRNFDRWTETQDNFACTPSRQVHRLLTRLAVENLFHPFQPFIIGQKSLAPKMSILHRIPLVFYGESEAEYGNPKAEFSKPTRDNSFHSADSLDTLHLGGVQVDELAEKYKLSYADLDLYLPANTKHLQSVGTEVHYLGYYLKWKPQEAYYYAVENGGFEPSPERTPGTYSKYNSIDDKMDDFHYYCTYIKFGIGRATYDASQEIRSGDITREEGISLIRRFDGEFPVRFMDTVFEYLSVPGFDPMSKDRFLQLAEKFKSPHLWDGDQLKYKI
jgi:N-acetyl sugar amidotransferase